MRRLCLIHIQISVGVTLSFSYTNNVHKSLEAYLLCHYLGLAYDKIDSYIGMPMTTWIVI